MKKIILSISVVALLASCGSKEKEEKRHDEKSEANTEEAAAKEVDEAPKSVMMNSYDFLTKFKEEGDEFLNSLKGKEVIINQIVLKNTSMGEVTNEQFLAYTYGYGYNGILFSLYSDPDAEGGKKIIVKDKVMAKYSDVAEFALSNSTEENLQNFVNAVYDAESSTETFHTSVNIIVSGDNITSQGGITVKIDGAKIEFHENF